MKNRSLHRGQFHLSVQFQTTRAMKTSARITGSGARTSGKTNRPTHRKPSSVLARESFFTEVSFRETPERVVPPQLPDLRPCRRCRN